MKSAVVFIMVLVLCAATGIEAVPREFGGYVDMSRERTVWSVKSLMKVQRRNARRRLRVYGITPERAEKLLSRMNPAQLDRIAHESRSLEAGGGLTKPWWSIFILVCMVALVIAAVAAAAK